MYSHEEFEELSKVVAERFNLSCIEVHKNIRGFHVEGSNDDILRLIYVEKDKRVGIAFHIETMPTDAVTIYTFTMQNSMKAEKDGVLLLHAYFQDEQGNIFSGIDARYAVEKSRQEHYLQVFNKSSKEEIQKQLKIIDEKKKKTIWH